MLLEILPVNQISAFSFVAKINVKQWDEILFHKFEHITYISLFSIFRWWSWQLHENTIFLFINVQYQRRQTWRLYFQKRRYVLQAGLIKVWGFLTNSWRLLRNVMICTFLLGSLGIFASNAKIPEGLALKSLSFHCVHICYF